MLILLLTSVETFSSENEALKNAVKRFKQITTDQKYLADKWSTSYFIMYKRLYGTSAYLKDFQFLTGIGKSDKAALMYKAYDKRDDSWTTYLLKMKMENSVWQVQSIATYDIEAFELNKNALVE